MLSNLTNKRKLIEHDSGDESIGNQKEAQTQICPKEWQFIERILPNVDWNCVNDKKTTLFIDLVNINDEDENDDDDDDEEDDETVRYEREREEFDQLIEKLLNEQVDQGLIQQYELFVNEQPHKNKRKSYYVYSIHMIDKEEQTETIKLKYFGKGRDQRALAHLRVAFLCNKFEVSPSTLKTEWLMNELKNDSEFMISKTKDKLEVDALIRETLMIQLGSPDALNIDKSSINLSKFDLNEAVLNEIRKSTLQELLNGDDDSKMLINLEFLIKDFESTFEPYTDRLSRSLDEDRMSELVYLLTTNNRILESSFSCEHKLIILVQVLIWLDSEMMLSNKGINMLFGIFGLNPVDSVQMIGVCLNRFVRKLVFANNWLTKIYELLDQLKSNIEESLEIRIAKIVEESHKLLIDPKLKRKIIRRYLPGQLYAITKIVETSEQNGQFLNPDCNWAIYNEIPGIESTVKHERSNFIDIFKKIKQFGRYHVFDGLKKVEKKSIQKIFRRRRRRRKKVPRNLKKRGEILNFAPFFGKISELT